MSPTPCLGDAAKGTALPPLREGDLPEACNLDRQAEVAALHHRHVAAGAQWVTSNTFGLSRLIANSPDKREHALLLLRAGVSLAHAAVAPLGVYGSIGPTSAPRDRWEDTFRMQAQSFARGNVAGVLVETVLSCDEGLCALRAVREAGHSQVILSYTPAAGGDLLDGTSAALAAERWVKAGATVIGVNCGEGPSSLDVALQALLRAQWAPVYASPNAGLPAPGDDGSLGWPVTPAALARATRYWSELGVTWFAGCCGTTAEHLRAMRAVLSPPRTHSP